MKNTPITYQVDARRTLGITVCALSAGCAPMREATAPASYYQDGFGQFPQVFTTSFPIWENLIG